MWKERSELYSMVPYGTRMTAGGGGSMWQAILSMYIIVSRTCDGQHSSTSGEIRGQERAHIVADYSRTTIIWSHRIQHLIHASYIIIMISHGRRWSIITSLALADLTL